MEGTLVYLSEDQTQQDDYKTAHLRSYNFHTGQPPQDLGALASWNNLIWPQNAAFSSDGSLLVFSAYAQPTTACPSQQAEYDVFLWDRNPAHAPVDQTPNCNCKSVDPRFAPDGQSIVYKQYNGSYSINRLQPDIHLSCATPGGAPTTHILVNAAANTEVFAPAQMPDGTVLYTFGKDCTSAAGCSDPTGIVPQGSVIPSMEVVMAATFNADGSLNSSRQAGDGTNGFQDLFPVPWVPAPAGTAAPFLFFGWEDPANARYNAYVYSSDLNANQPNKQPLFFNLTGCDSDDPEPADSADTLVFFSSARARSGSGCAGGAPTLFIAQIDGSNPAGGQIWSLDVFDSSINTSVSNIASAYAAQPSPPVPVLSATPGEQMVSLDWSASASGATYNIYRGTSPGGEALVQSDLAATTATFNGLGNGTTYYFYVEAVTSAGGSGSSNEVSAVPGSSSSSSSGGGSSSSSSGSASSSSSSSGSSSSSSSSSGGHSSSSSSSSSGGASSSSSSSGSSSSSSSSSSGGQSSSSGSGSSSSSSSSSGGHSSSSSSSSSGGASSSSSSSGSSSSSSSSSSGGQSSSSGSGSSSSGGHSSSSSSGSSGGISSSSSSGGSSSSGSSSGGTSGGGGAASPLVLVLAAILVGLRRKRQAWRSDPPG